MKKLLAALLASSSLALAQNSGPSPEDSAGLATTLGPLAQNLVISFSMDRPVDGSIVYRRPNPRLRAVFFGPNEFVENDGRQCTSFAKRNSFLKLFGILELGRTYTLAGWIKLPAPTEHAVLWDGLEHSHLTVIEDRFVCTRGNEEFVYAKARVKGWHHVAVTCDGTKMTFFLDGAAKGTVPIALPGGISRIGSNTRGIPHMCDLVDDIFFFDRDRTADEIAKVFVVKLPPQKPTKEELAATYSFNLGPASPTASNASAPPASPSTTPSASALLPASAAAAANASEIVKAQRNNLVFVSGDDGSGSGFIAKYGNRVFLFTNAHVAAGVKGAGFQTLQGDKVQIGGASVAVGHDIFLMQATANGHPLEIMTGVDEHTSIGDEIVVLGNAEGAGVINTIMGKIVGVGPNLVEVDAPFKPGNSGSPIIHLKSGKVIGAATYLTMRKFDSATNQPVKDPIVRRFGYRIDSVKSWQPVQWPAFFTQAKDLELIETLTDDLVAFLNDLAKDSKVDRGLHNNPVIKSRIDAWLTSKMRGLSDRDRFSADQNFLSFLKITCQSDLTAARPRMTYDYFQRALGEQQKQRTQIAEIFDKIIKDIGR